MAKMKSKSQLAEKDVRKMIQEYWETIGTGNGREKGEMPAESERPDLGSALKSKRTKP